jgi:fimbrial chaperone protein
MGWTKRVAWAATIALAAIHAPTWAYDLKPIVIQLAPSGAGTSQMVTVTNSEDTPVAIEAKTYRRGQDRAGNDTLEPEEQDLLIVPPQMVIPPKASQTFKVQWLGDNAPQKEIAFRLVTEQLPIDLPAAPATTGKVADVQVQYRYEAALYITPPKSKPSLVVDGAELVKDEKGAPQLKLSVTSTGTRRAILDKPSLTITPKAGGDAVTLTGDQLKELSGKNVLAGASRDFLLPWPAGLPQGPVTASLNTSFVVMD